MFNQDRKQRKFITITTSVALVLFLPFAMADVILVPGHIVGNVQIGSETIDYMQIGANNSDDNATQNLSPGVVSAPYDLTVNVPTGTTPAYTVYAQNIRTRDSATSPYDYDYFSFPSQSVVANETTPVTADFELLSPNYVEGTVTLTGSGELSRVYVYANPVVYSGYSHYTNQYADNSTRNLLDFEFPVSGGDMRCNGTAYLVNGAQISLPNQNASPVGGMVTCDWTIATPETGQIEGTVEFTGPLSPDVTYVNSQGSTNRTWYMNVPGNPENYVLDDLSVGNYNVNAYSYFNGYQTQFNFPHSAFDPSRSTAIAAGDVDVIDISACQSFIDGAVNLAGAATWSQFNSAQFYAYGRYDNSLSDGGPSYGASARDQLDTTNGDYELIASPGDWISNYLYLYAYDTDPVDYLNEYMYIYDRSVMDSNNPINLAACGVTASRDFDFNMGMVTVNLSVAGGEVLSNPRVQGYCYEYDANNVLLYYYYFSSTNSTQSNVTDGFVNFVAPQANCTGLQADATVGGTQTTFGELDIEVIGGGEVVIDFGGPGLTIAEPEANLCINDDETTVSGTATDDVGVATVTVNGMAAVLNPAGGDGTLSTDFSATIPLFLGANSVETIATDTSGKTGSDTRTVYRDAGAPSLSWTPANGDTTPLMTIDVVGTVSDDVGIDSVTVNGVVAVLTPTGNPGEYSFDVSVPLALGSNNITVVVTEETGCAEVVEVREVTVIENLPPEADAGGPYSVDEGSSTSLDGSLSSDPDGDPITFEWDLNYDGITFDVDASGSATPNFDAAALDGPGSITVAVRVTDDEDESDIATAEVTVNNVAPTATFNAPGNVDEGQDIDLSLTAPDDPSLDDTAAGFEYAFDCGSGYGSFGSSDSVSCPTTDNEVRAVGGKIRDKDGDETEYTTVVLVNNVAPVIESVSGDTIDENGTATVGGTFSDVGLLDSFTVTIDWGEGAAEDYVYPAGSTEFSETHQYLDDDPAATSSDSYGITVTVTDDDGGSSSDSSASVVVNNLAPELGAITVDVDLVPIGTVVTASADFTDIGSQDSHSASWSWGDGSTAGTVTPAAGGGSVQDTHSYPDPGVYTIDLTVTDDDTGVDSTRHQYVVVYDPNGSFVTGGGTIDSPPGAYLPDPSLVGMANFGFVSKYKKGANVPTGHTEFQFHAAGLDFKSTEYEWLVIAGARAQFKGTGTIKDVTGSYRFFLTAIDGQVNGGGGSDKFRIRIWNDGDGDLIYDNELSTPDDADPTTVIQNGSIVIHSKGKK